MGDEEANAGSPAPSVTVERKSGSQIALALTVLALVLASNSIINEKWLTQSQTQATPFAQVEYNQEFGLFEAKNELCSNGDCDDTETVNFGEQYDECIDDLDGASSSIKEETCGPFADFHNAGFVTMILLILAAVILLVASVLQVRSMTGSSSRAANLFSGISGLWLIITLLVWYLMIPEADTEYEWSQGVWMVLISATCGLIAGFSGVIQSWIDGPPRMRARGVRSGTNMSEFVLKESSCGDQSLSILVDSDLIRIARVKRIGAAVSVEDILATRRDSYTGFSHQRLDWLDDFKGLWWVVAGSSLISSFMISSLFLIPFSIAAILAFLQLMDPERFVVSTNSGNHPFFINRWRSNRELTNLAMDLVDDAMIAVLRGDDLDTAKLETRAEMIAERFVANRESKRVEQAAMDAEKASMMQTASSSQITQIPAPPEIQSSVDAPEPSEDVQEVSVAETAPEEEASPEAEISTEATGASRTDNVTESESDSDDNELENSESEEPDEEIETSVAEEIDDGEAEPELQTTTPVSIPAPPPLPASIPPPPSSPPASAVTETPAPPVAIPAPPVAVPAPPVAVPAPPVQTPSPPVAIPAPPSSPIIQPPIPIPIPPPPSSGGMPAPIPPPPSTGGIPGPLPPMGVPQPMMPPPPVLVQASPREDNLTDDEKDDLLGDLYD